MEHGAKSSESKRENSKRASKERKLKRSNITGISGSMVNINVDTLKFHTLRDVLVVKTGSI